MYEKIAGKIGELMFTMRNITKRLDAIERVVNMNQLPVPGTGNNDGNPSTFTNSRASHRI